MAISSPSLVKRRIMPSGKKNAAPAKSMAKPREKRNAMPSTTWMAFMSPFP